MFLKSHLVVVLAAMQRTFWDLGDLIQMEPKRFGSCADVIWKAEIIIFFNYSKTVNFL